MPDNQLFGTILQGGAVAVVFYAFYMLLNNIIKGQSTFERALQDSQAKFLASLEKTQDHYSALLNQAQEIHRKEVEDITNQFTASLNKMSDHMNVLSNRVGQLDERVQTLANTVTTNDAHSRKHEEKMERFVDRQEDKDAISKQRRRPHRAGEEEA